MTDAIPSTHITAIIDLAIAEVIATKDQLGIGPPTPGAQYREAEVRLSGIGDEMAEAFAGALWRGPAGRMFTAGGEALYTAMERLSAIDHDVALCIHVQASEIWEARTVLNAIVADLCSAKKLAIDLVWLGNMEASETLQLAAAEKAMSRCRLAVEKLTEATTTHAGFLTQAIERLARLENLLSAAAVSSLSRPGGAVTVSDGALGRAASGLRRCSTALAAEWASMGPSILEEVRLTHGSGITDAFNISLGAFEQTYEQVLFAIWNQVEHCTNILVRAARLYVEYDTGAARVLMRKGFGF